MSLHIFRSTQTPEMYALLLIRAEPASQPTKARGRKLETLS
jgi:hypothetical protein